MCGIAGIFNPALEDGNLIVEMTQRLRHRGPDAEGFYKHDKLALGHTRLSIQDLSEKGNQPFFSSDQRYVGVFNGEIYNHQEIADKLSIKPQTRCDTEILLEAFSLMGPEFVRLLNGMFVFVVFDIHKQKLFLFRDRIGIKPLYYSHLESKLYFASEIKSLARVKPGGSLSMSAMYNFLRLGFIPYDQTIYSDIKAFPSGHWAEFDGKNLKFAEYWSADDCISDKPVSNYKVARQHIRDLLYDSIQSRLISDVPLGTFLSGGVDSSLVSAIAHELKPGGINTFNLGFTNIQFDESSFAEKVASYLGTNHHKYMVTKDDALDCINDVLTMYDQPFSDSSSIPTYIVSKISRQDVKVILSGDGGDELFQGYGRYDWGRRLENRFFNSLRRPLSRAMQLSNNSRYLKASRILSYNANFNIESQIFSQEQGFFNHQELKRLLQGSIDAPDISNEIINNRKIDLAERLALFDLKHYLKNDLLVKVDIASMANSLEVRVPLLDHKIVEFALNVDSSLKYKKGVTKYILKEVLFDFVPKELFRRPKWGFSIPLNDWLRTDLRYLLDNYLDQKSLQICGVFDTSEVMKLKTDYLKGQDYNFNKIWLIIVFQKWLLEVYGKENSLHDIRWDY